LLHISLLKGCDNISVSALIQYHCPQLMITHSLIMGLGSNTAVFNQYGLSIITQSYDDPLIIILTSSLIFLFITCNNF